MSEREARVKEREEEEEEEEEKEKETVAGFTLIVEIFHVKENVTKANSRSEVMA